MTRNQNKKHLESRRPFPWKCRSCGKQEVELTKIEYSAEAKHDGRVYSFLVPNLEIPACRSCGGMVFTIRVDDQINCALRSHLGLLSASEIRTAIETIGITQKELAKRLRLAEATISRWCTGTIIQSPAMDRYLRVFFSFPDVRDAFSRGFVHDLLVVVSESSSRASCRPSTYVPAKGSVDFECLSNDEKRSSQEAQAVVLAAGSVWAQEQIA